MSLVYTLLLTNNQKCCKCLIEATHILLGKENEFLGFYCQTHGEERHTALNDKFSFEAENRPASLIKRKSNLNKRIRRIIKDVRHEKTRSPQQIIKELREELKKK